MAVTKLDPRTTLIIIDLQNGITDIIPALGEQAQDIKMTKRTWGAFASTNVEQQLRAPDVSEVMIAGVATSIGVESTRGRPTRQVST